MAEKKVDTSNQEDFCCSHSKKACVVYFTQTIAIAAILVWALFMLSTQPDTNRDLYVSLLSTCLGVFLPQPKLPETEYLNKVE
jgi:hypothetical protein